MEAFGVDAAKGADDGDGEPRVGGRERARLLPSRAACARARADAG